MKVGALLGLNELKAPGDVMNGWCVVTVILRQLYLARLVAVWTP